MKLPPLPAFHMHPEQPFLIIGAGIGGLTLALGLQRAGLAVQVYEAAPQLGEVGAGLTISPNATRALEYLGLGETLEQRADRPDGGYTMYAYSGNVLYSAPQTSTFKDRHGSHLYQIHRADLHETLVAAVRANDPTGIHTDHTFVDLTQDETGVTCHFAKGQKASGIALIGCDGLRSAVRSVLFGQESPRFTGQVAFRGTVPSECLPLTASRWPSAAFVGPHRTFTRYFLRHGTLVNYVGMAESDAWREEGWTTPATVDEVLALYEGWPEAVRETIKATPPGRLHKWALFDRDPLENWTQGRVALMGDAAHPMLPFMGMGAAMAIEDSVVLTRCIVAAESVGEAFTRYQTARLERANSVLLQSRRQGKIYQTPYADQLKALTTPGEVRLGLYDYDPVTTPI